MFNQPKDDSDSAVGTSEELFPNSIILLVDELKISRLRQDILIQSLGRALHPSLLSLVIIWETSIRFSRTMKLLSKISGTLYSVGAINQFPSPAKMGYLL